MGERERNRGRQRKRKRRRKNKKEEGGKRESESKSEKEEKIEASDASLPYSSRAPDGRSGAIINWIFRDGRLDPPFCFVTFQRYTHRYRCLFFLSLSSLSGISLAIQSIRRQSKHARGLPSAAAGQGRRRRDGAMLMGAFCTRPGFGTRPK
jgi:hypothetical protein